jgi:hypothetical protein
MKRGH